VRPEAKRTGNLWRGPGVICGALPIGHRLQRATGEPCAFGDTLPADGVAILVEVSTPPEPPPFEPVTGEDEATTAKRRTLHGLMCSRAPLPFPSRALCYTAAAVASVVLLVRVAREQLWIPGCIVGGLSVAVWIFEAARSWRAWGNWRP